MIVISIKTDNDAFSGNYFSYEVARILKKIAFDYDRAGAGKSTYNDRNGNVVAQIEYKL